MNGAGEASSVQSRSWRPAVIGTGVAVGLALAGWAAWRGASAPAGKGDATTAGSWTGLALLVLLPLLIAAAAWIGAELARRRSRPALQQARAERQALARLLRDWYWRTDASHRIVELQPPHEAPVAQWGPAAPTGRSLWEHFLVDDAQRSALESRMRAGATLDGVLARTPGPEGTTQAWRLQGIALQDDEGHFAGYAGIAHPSQIDGPAAVAQELVDALPVAACGIGGDADAGRVEVRPNAVARELLNLPGGPLGWGEFLRALPPPVRASVEQVSQPRTDAPPPPDESGWVVAVQPVGRPAVLHVLTLLPQLGDGGAAAELARSDQESFSYTVSHDLRAPIRVVEGFARIVKEDYGRVLDRIGLDHLDRVLGAAARMNSMIDALLNLSQLSSQPLARQPVNLSQLAGYVIDDLRRHAPEREVEVHIQEGMTTVGDPTLLRLVLENLLGNAWKYSAKARPALLRFEAGGSGERPIYTVRDNGAGFDMRFADRLFGVFQRLHSASEFQGTGVGLASVRKIVRRHGGEIWAESEVGRGAAFHFTLKG